LLNAPATKILNGSAEEVRIEFTYQIDF
jgi:hypothetical protein